MALLKFAFAIVLSVLMMSSAAHGADVIISGDASHYELNDRLTYAIDTTGNQTLEQMLQRGHWQQKTKSGVLNLGFTSLPAWLRITVNIPRQTSRPWYLVIPYPLLENVDLYVLRDGRLPAVYHTSSGQASQESSQHRSYMVRLPLPTGLSGRMELVLRARSSTSLQIPVELWREDYLFDQFSTHSLYWGGYFGILCALVIYNLFLFLSIRDPAYGYYVLFLTALGVLMLCISGLGRTLIWPDLPALTRYALPISTGLLSLWALLFARSFLRWPGFSTRLHTVMKATSVLAALLVIYTLVDPTNSAQLAALLGGLVITLLISAGVAGLMAGVVIARYFVLAWSAFAAGVCLYLLNVFNLLPVNSFTNYAIQAGSAAEVLLLSFALAHRIKEERTHKIDALHRQQKAERQVRKLELETLEQAMHDSLTRMPNTSLLNQRLHKIIRENTQVALVLAQYPQIKDIASSMGHSLAEDMFCQLVNKLNHALTESAVVICLKRQGSAHLAIPEFGSVAFLIDLTRFQPPLEPYIEQLLGYHEISVNTVKLPLFRNLDCGVAIYPHHGATVEALTQNASAARDSSARDNVPIQVYNTEISAYARRRLALLSALPSAISSGELELYLQPQMNGSGKQLMGAELLLRWQSPQFGQVPALEFIDIAENAGLMDMLSRFVVEQSWETMGRLRANGLDITCSINLSIQNLASESFVANLLASAQARSVPMDRMIFEVTETCMTHNMDTVIRSLQSIADSGGRIALDDFGTGYSSLAYLSRLPIHELKIDRSFIRDVCSNRNDRWIVESTIKLAHSLHLETVAEGIEDAQTLALLEKLGCHRMQGYYLAKPMPLDTFIGWAQAFTARS